MQREWQCIYSKVSNNRTVSNKSVQGCDFELLVHKNARFWPFLAHSCHEINSRTCTFIKDLRVHKFQYFAIILVTLCVCSKALPSSTFLWEFAKKYHRTNIILHVQNDTAMRMTKEW